ncbi:MAG TPA: HEAT repeat domain-containing protein, partial [Pyrinomonadaceae bacterium]|nr:HEAT repeat domain-containing protein [Pyrinomonadaceae bacterium]
MLVLSAGISVSAQRRRRPPATTQQQTNANTAQQQKPPKKNITPLHTGDTSEGSRITITSDAPLNDYSAFRSGDRYYVVIPQANVARAQSGLKGRGFEDVQLQRRGDDAILSFKLQPGTNAHVNQRFNRLDVELNTPGGGSATAKGQQPTGNPQITTQPTPKPTPQTITGQTTTGAQVIPGMGITGQQAKNVPPINPAVTNPAITPPVTAQQTPTVTNSPNPEAVASPNASTEAGTATGSEEGTQGSTEASPGATPSSEQIAQAEQPPSAESGTTSGASSSSSVTLGATLRENWFLVLIGALVLLSLVMIAVAQRSARRRRSGAPVLRPPSRKERGAIREAKATPTLKEAAASSVVKAASSSTAVASTKPEVDVEAVAAPILAAEAVKAVEAKEQPPAAAEEETVEVAPAVDVERVDLEVKNVLSGESYDESIIGASDAGTRQLVATELLSALAARNLDRRERAREVFIKHGYLDEATKNLRTADAPAERAAAARTLGFVKDKSTTPHLVAALEDEAPVVRRASVEA